MKPTARPAEVTASYLASYVPDGQRYDELLDARGSVRPHWQALIDRLAAGHMRERVRRGPDVTRRLIVENGITYNVYADTQGADRPWSLDPLPLLITPAEWREIEHGIDQRARLLDALLADLYGPQQLLAEGLVPAELPFGHPNFLWPCYGVAPADRIFLHLYAADLARAPDGRWWVLADRTQAPSGAGYALENREILEQLLPEPLRDLGVRGVRGFFGELRARMLSYVDGGESPLAVILTPGPYNETYFEHAFLARQLGWPLVEGSDLTVRDDTVYLKTLAGLKRVHAIVRRLDDDYCDPLELRSGSALGVPGLIGVVRARRVALANALGTGVLESAAWLGFLPGVAERLLGETLSLPTVATWWCGERPALESVIENLERLVVKPAYPNQRFEPVFGNMLTSTARAEMVERLKARPNVYVAQEHLALSQTPVLRSGGAGGFAAKSVVIRVYALATPGGRLLMPGGLARIATGIETDVVSAQRGGGSKDIWILGAASVPEPSAIPARSTELPVRHEEIPSRLVENLYWFGRYTARCEDRARLLKGTLAARIDPAVFGAAVKFCRELGVVRERADPARSLRDEANPEGILADVRRLARCASQVRGRLSASYWHAVAQLQRQLQPGPLAREDPRESLERLLLSLGALAGFALDDMTQDAGWRLLRVGRRLERLQFVAQLLARHLASATASRPGHIEWLLEACDSLRVYRSRYAAAPRVGPLLDLLIRDAAHPRALAFQRQAIARDLGALTALAGVEAEQLTEDVPALSDGELLALEGESESAMAARAALAARLQDLGGAAAELSDRLSMRHFSHTLLDSQVTAS
ncbi:MAG TPA: circularly permuted type 2 ATP-grasp protein [Steroidobacteraceae bacterium]|nr:circularly permuted type 2 ATP-grasp protein [Steroidobacteraceae bacterium]